MSSNLFNPADHRVYPSRWKICRGKQLFRVIDVRSSNGEEELLTVSHITGITPRSQKSVTMFKAESLVGYKICQVNDIAANTMWTWQGAIGVSKYHGVVSPAYNVYRQRGDIFNPRYLDLLLRERKLVDVYHSLSTGIRGSRLRLYPDVFLTITFPVPPRAEQDQIVRFLDWKVSGINKLISIKKLQILVIQELVNKQYQTISSAANRKAKLRYAVSLNDDFIEIDKDKYYIKTGMFNKGRGIFRREAIRGDSMGDSAFQRIKAGCVMISGQFAWEAATYVTTVEDESGVASHRYYLLFPQNEIPAEYIWCFLMSDYGQMQMKSCSHGAAGRNRPLNIMELLNVYLPIPTHNSKLDSLIQNVQVLMKLRKNIVEQERLLSEWRTYLISNVVTGKIDVRDVKIPDYEFVGEDTSNDTPDEMEQADENDDE